MNAKSYYFKFKLSLILSVLLLILVAAKIPLSFDDNFETVKLDGVQTSSINLVNPIFINDTDPNYNWSKTAAENEWCSGSGSWSDPYVIQNITINGNNVSNCIDIQNSNKYFTVKNCTVYNSSSGHSFAGINLDNVNNSLIFDNNCSFNYGNGIRLIYTYNNTVLDNFAKNNTEEGIYLSYSANNTMRNNNIGNNHRGILISNCGANLIIDNNSVYGTYYDFSINSAGIDISFSHNSTITNNNVFNNDFGIYCKSTSNFTLKGNNIYNNSITGTSIRSSNINLKFVDNIISNSKTGISLSGIPDPIVRNNTILSCDYGISIANINNITISDNYLINCSIAGIRLGGNSFNITLTRNNLSNCEIYVPDNTNQIPTFNITKSNLIEGKPVYFYTNKLGLTATNFSNPGQIILFNCNDTFISNLAMRGGINLILCKNNTITDNIVQANYYGIHLRYCDNNTVLNNTVLGSEYGIYVDGSINCKITKNNVEHCDSYGLFLINSFNNSLHENTMENNYQGLLVAMSSENNITENSVKNNLVVGMYITSSSMDNNIISNSIGNSWFGIALAYVSNNTLFGNSIVNSSEIGITIWTSTEDNLLYDNTLIGNTLNAQDNGTTNKWDNGVIGNFWDDYNGDDVNLDGIGDTQYNISGLASSVDRFPQIIKSTPQIFIENPYTNELFSYNPPDINLTIISPYNDIDSIWYSLSNETYTTNNYTFTGSIEQAIWDFLGNGTVSLKFYANNSYGLIGSSEVRVWKDIIAPQISIFSPVENQEFTLVSPVYNISILEANLESVWYTIDNGANNFTFTSLTGTINQIAWDAAPVGPVTIQFYARDDVGNIGTSSVIVAKIPSDTPTPPGIPGYNLMLVIGIVSVISLVLAKKRFIK